MLTNNTLDKNVILMICDYLSMKDTLSLLSTCKKLYRLTKLKLFWRKMFERNYNIISLEDFKQKVNYEEGYKLLYNYFTGDPVSVGPVVTFLYIPNSLFESSKSPFDLRYDSDYIRIYRNKLCLCPINIKNGTCLIDDKYKCGYTYNIYENYFWLKSMI